MIREIERFYLTKGDTYEESWYLTDDDDIPYDLSIYDDIVMDIRFGISNESRLLASLSLGNGITIDGLNNNILLFNIDSDITKDFSTGVFYRDIRFIENGKVQTFLKGKVEIRKNIS